MSLKAQEPGGSLLVLAAAALWGTTGTAQAFAPVGADPLAVGAVRLAIGGLFLLGLAAWRGLLPWPNRGATPRADHWQIGEILVASASMAGYQLCFFTGVARTGVAIGAMIAIGSAPILAGLLGIVWRGERPNARWLGATTLAVFGCSLLAMTARDLHTEALGMLLALGAGLAYAVYAVASKGLLEEQPPDLVVGVVFTVGALWLAPLFFFVDLHWLTQPRGLAVALELGLLATALAYLLYARGLRCIPVATAVTLSLGEPLVAGMLGVLLLGEQLTPLAWGGAGCLLVGLLWLARQ